jgi:hypothetical protein
MFLYVPETKDKTLKEILSELNDEEDIKPFQKSSKGYGT